MCIKNINRQFRLKKSLNSLPKGVRFFDAGAGERFNLLDSHNG